MANSCDKPCLSPGEINSKGDFLDFCDEFNEDFDAESILDEEIEEGIDSIMGNPCVEVEPIEEQNNALSPSTCQMAQLGTCYGYPVGLGFGFGINFDYGFGTRNNIKAFRNADGGDWLHFPSVNVHDITPKFHKCPAVKKKKKKVEKLVELKNISDSLTKENAFSSRAVKESCAQNLVSEGETNERVGNVGLLLNLNYDGVLKDWSDGPSPFSDDSPVVAESSGNDVQVCFFYSSELCD